MSVQPYDFTNFMTHCYKYYGTTNFMTRCLYAQQCRIPLNIAGPQPLRTPYQCDWSLQLS